MRGKQRDESYGMGAWVFGFLALLLGFGALIVASQALSRSDDAKDLASAAQGTPVGLKEFAIDPSTIAVDTGGSLTVKNTGTLAHNLRVFELQTAFREIERVASQKFVVVESYRNEAELFNLECWSLTCESFFDVAEWIWLMRHFGYSGDYEFIFFE